MAETETITSIDDSCQCLRCVLNRRYDEWMGSQPDHSVDPRQVTDMAVKFLGDVLSGMPMYEECKPIRITITGTRNEKRLN